MDFKDLNELKELFVKGTFKFPQTINISDVPYKFRSSSEYSMMDMIKKNYKSVAIYQVSDVHKEEEKASGLRKWILLIWGMTGRNRLIPFDVRTMSRARAEGKTITEKEVKEIPDNIIGSTVEIRFTNLTGSHTVKGKVDTGATICSLHADNYKINRDAGTITFKTPQLSQNELTVPLVDQQSVKSADGGAEYRPVIELNVKVNGKVLTNVKFNLNDRSHMEFPILLGRNALEQGKFMIDPRMDEEVVTDDIDWVAVQEEIKSTGVIVENEDSAEVKEIYKILKESDITFSDIVRFIRTDVTENIMEDLDK